MPRSPAKKATRATLCAGSLSASNARHTTRPICASNIQERRRPNQLSSKGSAYRSTIGAHIHLKE
jgi:hypothetical protein